MSRKRWQTAATLGAAFCCAVMGLTVAPAHAAPGVTATFTKTSDWGSGFTAQFKIQNGGSAALSGWTIEFDFPAGTSVGAYWDATMTKTNNHYKFVNRNYNGAVPVGGAVTFGFNGSGSGVPAGCKLNNDPCDGSPPVDTTPPTAPGAPQVNASTSTSISLSWSASTDNVGVTGYEVLRGGTVVGSPAGTTYTDSGLTADTAYSYQVRARDAAGNRSGLSPAVNARTQPAGEPDTVPPTTPGTPQVGNTTDTSVSLSWSASTDNVGVTGYEVLRGGTVVGSPAGTTYTDSGLTADTAYSYQVRARDAAGNRSGLSAVASARTKPSTGPTSYAKVGYFPQWGIYGRKFFLKNLDTSGAAAKLTHLNYSFENIHPTDLTCFATTKSVGSNPSDPNQGDGAGDATADYVWPMEAANSVDGKGDGGWAGPGPLKGNFNQLKQLKAKHPQLKTLVSLGGWTFSKFFSDAAKTDASRKKLASSCIDMYIKGNLPKHYDMGGPGTGAGVFDGIDLDWEWPGAEGHPGNHFAPEDKVNNSLLIEEFRRQLDALGTQTGKRYLLTAFTPADPVKANLGWELNRVSQSLDLLNFQGYDFHGSGSDNSWEPNRTGHHANQHTDVDDPYATHFSNDVALQIYIDAGVDMRKLTLGVPFYGRGWKQVADGGKNGEWQSANGAATGDFPEEAGVMAYKNLKKKGLTVHHDEQAIATYGYSGNNGEWWSFDDEWSMGKKVEWLKSKGLGGVMIWEMSGDDGTLMNVLHNGLK